MKSLNAPPELNNPNIFTPEITKWIINEGFEFGGNDSYCYKEYNENWVQNCYSKYIKEISDFSVTVYIFENGIGIDVDYDCGGNMSSTFYPFSEYTFEQAYDAMVDSINSRK